MPTIRVDHDVWEWLKSHARPLEDTPNSVLRRVAGLDSSGLSHDDRVPQDGHSYEGAPRGQRPPPQRVRPSHRPTPAGALDRPPSPSGLGGLEPAEPRAERPVLQPEPSDELARKYELVVRSALILTVICLFMFAVSFVAAWIYIS